MKALILAAGRGRNLEPLTATRPKPMVSLCGRPVLERLIRMAAQAGIGELELVVGHGRQTITDHFGRGEKLDLAINYAVQDEPSGIGAAILRASPTFEAEDFFLLAYGDVVTARNIVASTLDTFGSLGQAVAAVCLPPASAQYGNVYMEADMRITRLLEKPGRLDLGNYVLAGIFVLPGSFIGRLRQAAGDLVAAFEALISSDGLYASIWEDEWVDIAYPWDILSANRIIMDGWDEARIARGVRVPGSVELAGPVYIEPGVVLEAGSSVLGPCFIGRDTYIGHNVLVRQYTSLGPGCTVGFGVELKNSVLFGDVEIGRLSFVGDSVIGRGVDLGAGTMTVNRNVDRSTVRTSIRGQLVDTRLEKLGALIGDGASVGAGNTLLPGSRIGAGCVVPPQGQRLDLAEEP